MTREEFNELSDHLKFRAFTIAYVSSEDLINKLKTIYEKGLKEGKTKAEVLQEVKKLLPDLTSAHLSTHYNTNVMTAYNAGKQSYFRNSKSVHYLMYNAILDGHTTKLCRKLHGTIKPKDDPFWDRFYPPNHYNCRSTVYPVHRGELGKKFTTVEFTKDGKLRKREIVLKPSKLTGKFKDPQILKEHQFKGNPEKAIYEIPDSLIDRALNYGILEDLIETAKGIFQELTEEKLKQAFGFTQPKTREFMNWVKKIIKSDWKPKGELKNIGWIDKDIRELVEKLTNFRIKNPVITVNDRGILHMIRDAKNSRGASVPIIDIYRIPKIIAEPEAVLLDTKAKSENPVLLFVKDAPSKKAKFVVKLETPVKVKIEGKKKSIKLNLLRTSGLVKKHNLLEPRYILLKGKIK
ncbi:minor capsid protein [Desulfurobacterium crinifex]